MHQQHPNPVPCSHRRGEVTSPDGLGNPTPTHSMVCHNTTLRSSGARGLDVSRCYRHIAPLERKAPTHQNSRCVMHRRGEVTSPDGLGNPTPTHSMVCHNTTLRSSGARGLDVSRCYRHIAPLERKAPTHQNSRCVMHRRGEVTSPDGLGNPTPTGFTVRHAATCRPSGALVIWCMPRAINIFRPAGAKGRIESLVTDMSAIVGARFPSPSPDGLGNPTPTDSTSRFHSSPRRRGV